MPFTVRPARLAAFAAALSLVVALPAGAEDSEHHGSAANVTTTQADLTDTVSGDGAKFTWHFDYGTTTDYGQQTGPVEDPGSNDNKAVTASVTELTPGTTYHARLSWEIGDEHEHSDDFVFTTQPEEGQAAPAELVPEAPGEDPAAPETATLAQSALTSVAGGKVLIRIPGWQSAALLAPEAHIPIGSVLDTREGSVRITTALAGGATQTATFHGGVFSVSQKPELGGVTDIALKASPLNACAASARAAGTVTRRKPRELGRLWGSDNHGKYRTHGRNSVATVRGTSWLTVERCDGTLTQVSKGAVSVFDRRLGKRVLVKAGERYLARKG